MPTVLKPTRRDFQETPNKIDPYRLFTDMYRAKAGINPGNLNFDLWQLNPGQYSTPYHFYGYGEESFFILSRSNTLHSPEGIESVNPCDLIFFKIRSQLGSSIV
jgi:hypothetical protein